MSALPFGIVFSLLLTKKTTYCRNTYQQGS